MVDLIEIAEQYRAEFGEPQYLYFKKRIPWASPGRGRRFGEHIIPIGDGEEISKEEYDANIAEYEHVRRQAFLGKHPQSYWRFDQKLVKDGWHERLLADVEALSLPSHKDGT